MTENRFPIHLTLERFDGTSETHTVEAPGGLIRVAVGEPGRRSAVWRIWAGGTKSDVYVAIRDNAHRMKYSFHESGDWRDQFVSREQALKMSGWQRPDRVIQRWRRPEDDAMGWAVALSIIVPDGDVGMIEGVDRIGAGDDVMYIPEDAEGRWTILEVVVAKPIGQLGELIDLTLWAGFALANGEVVLLMVGGYEPGEDRRAWLLEQRRSMGESRRANLPNFPMTNARLMLPGELTGGGRCIYDMDANRVLGEP